ncbi:hypothetical protein [Aquirufa aurantiipilula]|uniref:hypothetical protein n=1 Tax=Aquirufa aurantiipilula TaxID=2696561 RepID=UPI001CAA4F4E|nr:hypothetical protein [Aquirufa aurantiipilula]
MVIITDYIELENAQGEHYIALELSGDLELVQSKTTNKMYATSRRTRISSTFTKEVAQKMIGKELNGSLERVEVEPYDYVIPDTGEVIRLAHRYEYFPAGSMPTETFQKPETSTENGARKLSLLKR